MPGAGEAGSTGTFISALLRQAGDRSALSDELHYAARTDAERLHLDHGRANLLRALDLPAGATVLEIGAGSGSLTRYLAESVAAVHAVEPDPALAEATRVRCAGLPGVTVSAALPETGAYDLVVTTSPAVPADLPGTARRLLRSGGTLCLALTPDESTVDAFRAGRHAVVASLRGAGFTSATVLGCLPDHRIARLLLTEELARDHPRLVASLTDRPDADPWRSFLVLAGNDAPVDPLWPSSRLGAYFNTAERAAPWCTRATVLRTPTGASVRRVPLRPDPPVVEGISVRECTDPVVNAPTMLAVLRAEPWRAAELLGRWRDLLAEQAADAGPALWDLLPHNVLVDGGALRPIDLEWEHAGAGVREVLERGLLVSAHYLTEAGWAGAAQGGSARELAAWLGVLIGVDPSFVDDALERETHFATIGSCGSSAAAGDVRAAIRQIWTQRLEARVEHRDPPVAPTLPESPLEHAVSTMDRTIALDDPAYYGSISGYFAATAAALRAVLRALDDSGIDRPDRVLDLGCRYGAVLRGLRTAFPDAELLATEEDPAALRFCVDTFGAVAAARPTGVRLAWCGRALHHADAEGWDLVRRRLAAALAPGGLAVLSVPGRRSAELLRQGRVGHDLPVPASGRALTDYRAGGFGHAAHPTRPERSLTLCSPDWAVRRLLRDGVFRLTGYAEAGLGDEFDVVVLRKDAAVRVRGEA